MEPTENNSMSASLSYKRGLDDIPTEHVYVLRLQNGGLYVGSTSDLSLRKKRHIENPSPIVEKGGGISGDEPVLTLPGEDVLQGEVEETHIRMLLNGANKVRGAQYLKQWESIGRSCQLEISRNLCHRAGACYTCGGFGHDASQCLGEKRPWLKRFLDPDGLRGTTHQVLALLPKEPSLFRELLKLVMENEEAEDLVTIDEIFEVRKSAEEMLMHLLQKDQ